MFHIVIIMTILHPQFTVLVYFVYYSETFFYVYIEHVYFVLCLTLCNHIELQALKVFSLHHHIAGAVHKHACY